MVGKPLIQTFDADEYAGIIGVYRNRGLTLWPVLVAHIDVWTTFYLAGGCCLERWAS